MIVNRGPSRVYRKYCKRNPAISSGSISSIWAGGGKIACGGSVMRRSLAVSSEGGAVNHRSPTIPCGASCPRLIACRDRHSRSYPARRSSASPSRREVPAEARSQILGALKTTLVDPILADQSWSPERADEALTTIATVAVRLAQVLGVPVPPHSQPLALELVPLPEVAA